MSKDEKSEETNRKMSKDEKSEETKSIEQIVEQAPDYLVADGWLLLEHGFDQADAVIACMRDRGFHRISSRRDWSGQPRMTGAQWPR